MNDLFNKSDSVNDILDLLVRKLDGQPSRDGFLCYCPAHNDKKRSLSLTVKDDKLFYYCCAGCTKEAVMDALVAIIAELPGGGKLTLSIPAGIPLSRNGKKLKAIWAYHDQDGNVVGYVARFESFEGKEVIPYFYRDPSTGSWKAGALKSNRHLYNLPAILKNTDKTIIICEGEKASDAAGWLLPDFVVTTSQGGSGAASLSDWSPLNGRRAIIWPDADDAGLRYAAAVVELVTMAGGQIIGIVDFEKLGFQHGSGADAADIKAKKLDTLPLINVADFMRKIPKSRKNVEKNKEKQYEEEKKSQADQIVELARAKAKFFCAKDDDCYAVIQRDRHTEIWPVRSKKFRRWLNHIFQANLGKTPSINAITQAVHSIEGNAAFESDDNERVTVHLRVAGDHNTIWYDLANKDWQSVKIDANGWSVESNSPYFFTRYKATGAQVIPQHGGDLRELLKFFDLSKADECLLLAYVVVTLVPNIPRPLLVVNGEKGSGKSTLLRLIKLLIDPTPYDEPLLVLAGDERELSIKFSHNYLTFFDNVSGISNDLSNFLCQVVTGSGFSVRELYTDDDERIYQLKRPLGISAINIPAGGTDLKDRMLLLELARIDGKRRMEESEIYSEFKRIRPQLIGAVLTALSRAISIKPAIREKIGSLPRMADFAVWGSAAAEALGYGYQAFLDAFFGNAEQINQQILESHPVGAAIVELMNNCDEWTGTPAELLAKLEDVSRDARIDIRQRVWPKSANALTRRIREVASNLKDACFAVDYVHGKKRLITIRKVKKDKNVVEIVDIVENKESQRLNDNDIKSSIVGAAVVWSARNININDIDVDTDDNEKILSARKHRQNKAYDDNDDNKSIFHSDSNITDDNDDFVEIEV
ncbi:MAG: hypothetical protein ACP5TY_04965 [Thermodesulforhabdaceae bacterium]